MKVKTKKSLLKGLKFGGEFNNKTIFLMVRDQDGEIEAFKASVTLKQYSDFYKFTEKETKIVRGFYRTQANYKSTIYVEGSKVELESLKFIAVNLSTEDLEETPLKDIIEEMEELISSNENILEFWDEWIPKEWE